MSVNFTTNVKWPNNELLFPADLFRVQVPSGLSGFQVRAPNYVDFTGMSRLSRSGAARTGAGGMLGTVNGLVTNGIQVRFENIRTQWRCTPAGGAGSRQGPGNFQFQGGNVYLDLSLAVYILNTNEPDPTDEISVDIFSAVYSHELLHVLDEIDIVRNWLPPRLLNEPMISRYLVQGQTFTYGTPTQSIAQTEEQFRVYIQNAVQTEVHNFWATEANRRQGLRDAPAQYAIVQSQIDSLRARQINR